MRLLPRGFEGFVIIASVLLGLSGCLSDYCEVYSEHCVEAADGGSDGSGDSGTTDNSDCGDGVVQPDEACDQGADNGPGNPCTSECTFNVCGDGEVGPAEACDDGNTIDDDECTNACALASCGDGVVGPGEPCDDGNDIDTDACLSTCVTPSCGDAFVFAGHEECDEGAFNSDTTMCTGGCTLAVCGDGFVWEGTEECDEGASNSDADICTEGCTEAVCGDGVVWDGVEVCDDDNASELDGCTTNCANSEVATLELGFSQVKQFEFSWGAVFGAEYYQLLESADVGDNFVQVGGDIVGESYTLTVPLHFRLHASYKLRACDVGGCTESAVVDVVDSLAEAVGYFKASNTDAGDKFGTSVALSGDGNTLAVGATGEDSTASGIGGDEANNFGTRAGAVYVFVRNDQDEWSQQAYVKSADGLSNTSFGNRVVLSDDGHTLAVGAYNDGDAGSGAAYVFARVNQNEWSQQAYLKASNWDEGDHFGWSVALSGDGDTLAVGAYVEESNATGIGGYQANNSAGAAGAVYVFVRNGAAWPQQAYVKASNTGPIDFFGWSVALSDDGDTLAVGAKNEMSSATGIGGYQANNSADDAGAVYVFMRNGVAWHQQAYVKASNTGSFDYFGTSVALSDNGNTLAVGAYGEDSSATGIGGSQANNSAPDAGAVYVFVRTGGAWSQQAYVKASNTGGSDLFGWSVALSGDGDTLAVGAYGEDSSGTGIGSSQADNSAVDAGAMYVFVRNGGVWSQQAYVKASNTGGNDQFGTSVALSGDGDTLAVGAYGEDCDAHGVSSYQANNSLTDAGAVYLY